jgi:hypothetical protein
LNDAVLVHKCEKERILKEIQCLRTWANELEATASKISESSELCVLGSDEIGTVAECENELFQQNDAIKLAETVPNHSSFDKENGLLNDAWWRVPTFTLNNPSKQKQS